MRIFFVFFLFALAGYFPNTISALSGGPDPWDDPSTSKFSQIAFSLNRNIGLDINLNEPGGILTALLPYVYIIAGLILLFMLITGGFQMLTAVSNPDQASAGKKRLTTAIGGFLLLFAVYWIFEAVQYILGLSLLGP